MRDLVLLLTHSGDYYTIDLVKAALEKAGAQVLRFNTDSFPIDSTLSITFDGSLSGLTLKLTDQSVDLQSVRAIWARRLWPGKLPTELDASFLDHCYRESRTAFFDAMDLLEHCRWINPLRAGRQAESKLRQLKLAAEVGLTIPTTIVSNDPEPVRQLFAQVDGKMVTKLLGPLSQTMDASGDFVYTSQVTEEDMQSIHDVRYAPQIFQPLIPKERELRAIFVGDKTFVGSIRANKSDHGAIDWRRLTTTDGVEWVEEELPEEVVQQTQRLMRNMGLLYGAVDFIVDTDGRYIFLELNQAGEWGWLQRDLGLNIAEAIAETLLAEEIKD